MEVTSKSKKVQITAFQRAFFSRLATISANSCSELIEKAKKEGVLPECSIAFWNKFEDRLARQKQKATQ